MSFVLWYRIEIAEAEVPGLPGGAVAGGPGWGCRSRCPTMS